MNINFFQALPKEKLSKFEAEEVVEKSHRKQSRDVSGHIEPLVIEKPRNFKVEEIIKITSQSRKSSDCIHHENKTKDMTNAEPVLGKFKSLQNMNTASNNVTLEKRATEETTKPDTLQDRSEITQDQQQQLNFSEYSIV